MNTCLFFILNFLMIYYGIWHFCKYSQSKDAEVTLKLGSTSDKREQYRLMRDAMEKRFIRITRGSIVGGVRLGMFTATFYGLQNILADKRGIHDVYNIVGAGSATAATFGLISKKFQEFISQKCQILRPVFGFVFWKVF